MKHKSEFLLLGIFILIFILAVTYTLLPGNTPGTEPDPTVPTPPPTAPVLTLHGGDTIIVPMGSIYQEPGFTAMDEDGTDLFDSVTVSIAVDAGTPGIYRQTYSVTNRFGLSASAERTVYVFDPALMPDDISGTPLATGGIAIEPSGKAVYLTFDDGPSRYTATLLDTLKKYDAKASFFVVNTAYLPILSRTAAEGHTVAIHTYSHVYSQIYANENAFVADINAISQEIQKYTGSKALLMRFAGGSSNTISANYNKGIMTRLVSIMTGMGYTYFDWNVDSMDATGSQTVQTIFNNVVSGIMQTQNPVVLQHDIHKNSVDAVEKILVWGICNGYRFEALTADSPVCHHAVFN